MKVTINTHIYLLAADMYDYFAIHMYVCMYAKDSVYLALAAPKIVILFWRLTVLPYSNLNVDPLLQLPRVSLQNGGPETAVRNRL